MSVQPINNAAGRRFEVLVKQVMARNLYLEASKELLDLDLIVDPATKFMQDQKIAEVHALLQGAVVIGFYGPKLSNVSVDIIFLIERSYCSICYFK